MKNLIIVPALITLTAGLLLLPISNPSPYRWQPPTSTESALSVSHTNNITSYSFNFDTHQVWRDGVECTPIPKNFTDKEELADFLKADNTDSKVFLRPDKDGRFVFANQCEDRAFQLRDNARKANYYVETEALERHEYFKWYGKWIPEGRHHMICKAFVGNDVWYIEPSSDKYWIGLNLD